MDKLPLKNWVPYKLKSDSGQFQCHWLNTSGERFTEPFFEETIMKCRSRRNRYFHFPSVSNLDMLLEWSGNFDDIIPSAIIFHISRCGSTLVSQMLTSAPKNIVLSEVPFFDDLLRLPFKASRRFTEKEISSFLKASVNFYGQKKYAEEDNVFIKTDSWHIFFYEQLRQLYPTVPFVFLYRSPHEVFRSHKKVPGMQTVPGLLEPELFGYKNEGWADNPDAYLATVLESFLKKYLQIAGADPLATFINYNEGPIPVIKKIARVSKISLIQRDMEIMESRALYHSKKPGELFLENETPIHLSRLSKSTELYHLLEERKNRPILPGRFLT